MSDRGSAHAKGLQHASGVSAVCFATSSHLLPSFFLFLFTTIHIRRLLPAFLPSSSLSIIIIHQASPSLNPTANLVTDNSEQVLTFPVCRVRGHSVSLTHGPLSSCSPTGFNYSSTHIHTTPNHQRCLSYNASYFESPTSPSLL